MWNTDHAGVGHIQPGKGVIVAYQAYPTRFGVRLRQLRKAAGLTQTALGEVLNIKYQAVSAYERGESEPVWGTVIRFAKALGVTPNEFLDPPEWADVSDRSQGHQLGG